MAIALVFAQLPAYMLHELEEHGRDRFRRWVNERLAGGREALTRPFTFAITCSRSGSCSWSRSCSPTTQPRGSGLIAVYTTAANALVHVAAALARREYNPGLVTAVALFVQLATWAAIEVNSRFEVSAAQQALAVGVAVAGQLAIAAILAAAGTPRRRLAGFLSVR